jgi:Sensors of blue-light using FAD
VIRSVVGNIVADSVIANNLNDLTGALLFTGTHFAQIIEGRGKNVDALLDSLLRDARHDQLQIIHRSSLAARRFKTWNLAYAGPAQFVGRHITVLLRDPSLRTQKIEAARLTALMQEFLKN